MSGLDIASWQGYFWYILYAYGKKDLVQEEAIRLGLDAMFMARLAMHCRISHPHLLLRALA